jgi:thiol:disulfide interchange protein
MVSYDDMGFKRVIQKVIQSSLVFLFIVSTLLSNILWAKPSSLPVSTASLHLSHISARPGDRIYAYINISLNSGWHTYWKNPGEVGAPLSLAWQLPKTIQSHPIQWMGPTLFKTGPIVSYGAKDRLLVEIPLDISQTAKYRTESITVHAKWLACREDQCIPVAQNLQAPLHIVKEMVKNRQGQHLSQVFNDQRPISISSDFAEYVDVGSKRWIKLPYPIPKNIRTIILYPNQHGLFPHHLTFKIHTHQNETYLSAPITQAFVNKETFKGVLHLITSDSSEYFELAFNYNEALTPPVWPLWQWLKLLLLAGLGGLILNGMPCVFPILSLKALALVQQQGHQGQKQHAWAYTLGIVGSLTILGLILMGLKSIGYQLGWGFHLQLPLVVIGLIWVMVFVTLHLLDWFKLPEQFYTAISKLSIKGHQVQSHTSGLYKSFLTGFLVTVTATPCTAPFMATAIGAALMVPPLVGLSIFATLGLGLASPFLILSYVPWIYHRFPKPGPWMVTFKKWLSLPMVLTVIWLIWVLYQQVPISFIYWVVLSILNIVILCRLFLRYSLSRWTHYLLILLTVIGMGLIVSHTLVTPIPPPPNQTHNQTHPFSHVNLQQLITDRHRVFVNVTAAWCITCQLNKQTTLSTDKMDQFFNDNDITFITADWTRHNSDITRYLNSFDRSGVPLYVFYNKNGDPIVLSQVLSNKRVIDRIKTHISLEHPQ